MNVPATEREPDSPDNLEENADDHVTRFAETAVELGYCQREKVETLAREHIEGGGAPEEFCAALVDAGVLTREQSRACERALRGRSTIGGFAILERVGQGGMGTVFRARQVSMDRIVAVKILAPKFAQDPSFKKRFLNEARTSAKLSHLNIINGIDCGEDCGYTFFAMEFVEGRTVKQVLHEKGKLPPDEAFVIVKQMADALSYARKFDLVHRDIKPDNIMLTPSGQAKLCDLGLAMKAETEQNEAVPVAAQNSAPATQSSAPATQGGAPGTNGEAKPAKKKGLALGTPHYMSPEQARGEANIDARSDIYSLGATFYHFLSGRTLFDGSTSLEVMTQQVVGTALNPCALDPEIPRGFGLIISKMTAKSAADRYANADELLADLNACQQKQPLAAGAFNARTSCAVLPGGNSSNKPGIMRWVPHVAAALLLGVLAYFGTLWLGGKPATVAEHDAGNEMHVSKDPLKVPDTVATDHKPPVVPDKNSSGNDPVKHDVPKVSISKEGPKVEPDKNVVKPPIVSVNPETPSVPDAGKKDPLPVIPAVPVEVANTQVLPPPAPELPKPELKLNADVLYARFLNEVDNRAGRLDLAKLYKEARDVSLAPEYVVARVDVEDELKDLKAALEHEQKTLKHLAEQGGDFEFSPEMAHKWGVPRGKLVGYDETRGLSIEIKGGAAFVIPVAQLPAELVGAKSQDKSALAQIRYAHARGNKAGVTGLLPQLPPEELKRWQRKSELLLAKEKELTARIAFENLQKIAEAHSWKTFAEMAAEFQRDFGSTPTARIQAQQIKNWEEAAVRSSQPPSKWRGVFHAASISDIPNKFGQRDLLELIYDFKTPEQLLDFNSPHGALRIENGKLIVREGGGEYATLRLFAPFQSILSFSVTARSRQNALRPFGVIFVEPAQVASDPGAGNTVLRLDPDSKSATLANWREVTPPAGGAPPAFDWLKDIVIAFDSPKGGDKFWSIDGKQIGSVKVPGNINGGWIALYGAHGDFCVSQMTIIFKPDPQWSRIVLKERMPPAPPIRDGPPAFKPTLPPPPGPPGER